MRSSALATTSYEPVVLRARSRTDGTIFEIVARFTTVSAAAASLGSGAGSGVVAAAASAGARSRSLVLRLDAHMVVSNRTGYSLQLIQPLLSAHHMAHHYAPDPHSGASMISAAATTGAAGLLGGPPQHSRSTPVFTPLASGAAGAGPTPPSSPFSAAAGGGGGGQRLRSAETLQLPPGAVGVPLHWSPAVSSRLLSLAVPEQQEGGGGGGWLLWAEPFRWGVEGCGGAR